MSSGPEISLDLIQRLPKTDLHCHLDGSLRLDTILDLARIQGTKLPTFDRAELHRQLVAGEHVTSLDEYLRAFDITLSVMQTEDALERCAYELAEDAWREHVRYIEVRYSPLAVAHWTTAETPLPRGFGWLAVERRTLLGTLFTGDLFPERCPPGHRGFASMLGGLACPEDADVD